MIVSTNITNFPKSGNFPKIKASGLECILIFLQHEKITQVYNTNLYIYFSYPDWNAGGLLPYGSSI